MAKDKITPINKDVLSNKIVDHLLQLIKDRDFEPGDQLPGERDLCKMLGVGRSSLREALRTLSHMNVLEVRPGLGTFVSSLEIEYLIEPIEFAFALDDTSIMQIFDARRTIELRTIELASQNITEEELADLETLFNRMRDESQPIVFRESLDREFHKLIGNASRNPMLYRFLCVVLEALIDMRQKSYHLADASTRANAEHEQILYQLKARDSQQARVAMLKHLKTTEANLIALISES